MLNGWIRSQGGGDDLVKGLLHSPSQGWLRGAKVIDLSSKSINGDALTAALKCLRQSAPGMLSLDLSRNGIDASDILKVAPMLADFPALRRLVLQENALGLEDFPEAEAVRALGTLTSLDWLDLSGNDMLDLPGLCESLRGLSRLKTLKAGDNCFTDSGNVDMSSAVSLRDLDLSLNPSLARLDSTLSTIPHLASLDVSVTSYQETISDLSACRSLRRLALRDGMSTSRSFLFLAAMPAMRQLDLRGTTLTEVHMAELAEISHLRTISLSRDSASEAAIANLRAALPRTVITTFE